MVVRSHSINLAQIQPTTIARGGWTISWTASLPPGSHIFLSVSSAQNRTTVTHGYGAAQLPGLLAAIGAADAWAPSKPEVWLEVEQSGIPITSSARQRLDAPVRPFDGPLSFAGLREAAPPLTYAGNGEGRMLTDRINGQYHFRHGRHFETNPAKRGLDCTTFPMCLFGLKVNVAGKYGTAVADALGAERCDMEAKRTRDLKAFYADERRGRWGFFIMWSEGHVVLVLDATIHEFNIANGAVPAGYQETPAHQWNRFGSRLWWVRRLPMSFAP